MPAQSRSLTPFGYLGRVAARVRRDEPAPMSWAHVLLYSIDTALQESYYRKEPRLRRLRDRLCEVLDRRAKDRGQPGLREEDLAMASSQLASYEQGRDSRLLLHERLLRWLSDRPQLEGSCHDWTLEAWRGLLDESGVEPGHFDGTRQWSSVRSPIKESVPEPEQSWLDELDGLVGLREVKDHVKEMAAFMDIERRRRSDKLPPNEFSLHHVFVGPPGTGKTSVARILAHIYSEFGVLTTGRLVEVDRTGLIGSYVGHTEEKTTEVINAALGGVLFIDEAYSLVRGGRDDFGGLAIDALVKRMEDSRRDLVVIVAGYEAEMREFLKSNPGLGSRFTSYIHFKGYSEEDLLNIFRIMTVDKRWEVGDDALEAVATYLRELKAVRGDTFGNAREVRTLCERMLRRQAARLRSEEDAGRDISGRLTEFTRRDVPTSPEER